MTSGGNLSVTNAASSIPNPYLAAREVQESLYSLISQGQITEALTLFESLPDALMPYMVKGRKNPIVSCYIAKAERLNALANNPGALRLEKAKPYDDLVQAWIRRAPHAAEGVNCLSYPVFRNASDDAFVALMKVNPHSGMLRALYGEERYALIGRVLEDHPTLAYDHMSPLVYLKAHAMGDMKTKALLRQAWEKLPPKETQYFLRQVAKDAVVGDLVRDVLKRLILPAYSCYAKDGKKGIIELQRFEYSQLEDALLSVLLPDVSALEPLLHIADGWHQPVGAFPKLPYLLPKNALFTREAIERAREWYPITMHSFTASNGLRVRVATNQGELQAIHASLKHCVDEYGDRCCKGDSHILSIDDAKGAPLSTVEIKLHRTRIGDLYQRWTPFKNGAGYIEIAQHEGLLRGKEPQLVRGGPRQAALKEWVAALANGTLPLNVKTGETDISRVQSMPSLVSNAGYIPCWENIERVFEEYKHPKRRGIAAIDEEGRVVYREPAEHLIRGSVTNRQGQEVRLRHVDVKQWLLATGLVDVFDQVLQESREMYMRRYERKDKVFGTKAVPLDFHENAPPQEVLARRQDYAFNAGTLKPHAAKRLQGNEAESYAARVEASRSDMFVGRGSF